MKKTTVVFFFSFFLCLVAHAQRHEIGIQLGTSSLVGDIGKTQYINPLPNNLDNIANEGIPFYGSLFYRLNFNPYQSIRFTAAYSHIQFDDRYAQEQYRRNRRFSGSNSIYEASAIFEYNFFPVNEEQRSMLSPYIFGGISGIVFSSKQAVLYNDFFRDAAGDAIRPNSVEEFTTTPSYGSLKNKFSLAIPFGIGLKYKFNYNWAVFAEFMFRPTFTDGLDYSTLEASDVKLTYNREITSGNTSLLQTEPYLSEAKKRADNFIENNTVGNINSKDWANTISLGVSYSFGRPPCYCD